MSFLSNKLVCEVPTSVQLPSCPSQKCPWQLLTKNKQCWHADSRRPEVFMADRDVPQLRHTKPVGGGEHLSHGPQRRQCASQAVVRGGRCLVQLVGAVFEAWRQGVRGLFINTKAHTWDGHRWEGRLCLIFSLAVSTAGSTRVWSRDVEHKRHSQANTS